MARNGPTGCPLIAVVVSPHLDANDSTCRARAGTAGNAYGFRQRWYYINQRARLQTCSAPQRGLFANGISGRPAFLMYNCAVGSGWRGGGISSECCRQRSPRTALRWYYEPNGQALVREAPTRSARQFPILSGAPLGSSGMLHQWSGSSWFLAQTLATYTAPNLYSPAPYTNTNLEVPNPNYNDSGYLAYSPFIEAQGTSAGWVVLAPAARSDYPDVNNYIFCTQVGGCSSWNYATDMFMGGVTTSPQGDMWISTLSYSGDPGTPASPNRTIPLQQFAAYGSASSSTSFITGTPNGTSNSNLDPTSWAWFPSFTAAANHCDIHGSVSCFCVGDYLVPAMNTVTGAILPFVNSPFPTTFLSELEQSFVQDPQSTLGFVPGLTFTAFTVGSDVSYKRALTPSQIARRLPLTHSTFQAVP